ncbi:MAG: gliding motility-associated C-terminal domain-containing protein [Bacteroidetes bacterium]|nr:MAG: gliding motility-associated C-terminal domain-containing protein [Bacteroidota bacterium]
MCRNLLFIALLFFTLTNLSAQCPPPGFPIPGNTCPEAPILCQDIDGYCTTINNNNITQNFPGCPNNVLNNDEWFAFFAGTPTITLQITPSNCQGTGGGVGLQAALYDGCQGSALATQCTCASTPFQLSSNNFVPGQIYWVVIDGCAGDICDYTVNVLAGSTVPAPPAPPGPVSGVTEVCPGSTQPYSLDPVFGATTYDWTLVPAIGTVSANDNVATVNWTLPGSAQLCVTVSNPCIANPVPSCITVNSTPIPPTDEEVELCLGKSVICAGQTFFTPGVFPVTLTSYLGCDSLINCIVVPIPPITNNLGQVDMCAPNTFEICNNFINQSGIYSYVCESYQGCDSTVIVDIAIMDPIANIAEPVPMIGCGNNAEVTLDGTGSNFNLVPDGNTLFNWTGPGIVGPANDVVVTVNQPGFYCLELTHERNGVSCTDTYCVDVFEDAQTPDPPLLDGPTDVCAGGTETYTVIPVGSVTPTGYTWTTPNGEPFNTVTATSISIDWTGSPGGDLCVTADNDCGSSEPTCITVNVSSGPEDPILNGPDTACDGNVLTYTITNPTAGATCTWTVPPGASFTDNGTSIDVDFSGAATGDVCVTCMNDCGTTAEICLPVVVMNVPEVPIISSGLTEVCDGATETYCVTPDPNATDYTWTTPAGTIPNASDCIDIDWSGLNGGNVCVTANNDCGSSQQTCIQVTVNDSPTAILSGGGDFCAGSGDTIFLTVNLTGIAPWNLTYSDSTNTFTENNINTSPFTIAATTPGLYTITSVSDASVCPGIPSGEASVVENPVPTVQLAGGGTICQGSGQTVDLTITLTGTPNWTVNWTSDGDDQAPLNITSSPYTLTIGQSQSGDIELTGVTDGNGCSNTGDGTIANVTVNTAPMVSNISTTCNATNTGFTVSFQISGGDSTSYAVTSNVFGVGGTISSSSPFIFVSDEIPSGDGYSFVVNDANNCAPVTIEDDVVICNCTTSVGDMDQAPVSQCGDDPVTVAYDSANEMLDADDVVQFVLHEGSGINIVNQIALNSVPTFGFQAGMTYGTTYYISAIAGNNDGNGNVNQLDPCLDVAQGTPVVFYEIPTAFMTGDLAICAGETAGLQVEFTGVGPWRLQYSNGTDTLQINGINANPFTLNVTPDSTTTYTLVGVSDDNCPGDVGGNITVTVNTAVQVSNIETTCNSTSTAYTLTFEISGGDPATYSVTGVNGTISAGPPYIFTSEDLPNNTGYDVTVDDANSCAPQNFNQNTVVCDCVTQVGTMDLTPVDECGDGPVNLTYDPTGQMTDDNDTLIFVLHTGTLNLGTIVQTNPTAPVFSFDPATMTYGTTYYASVIAGNDDGSGNVDTNDPCFAFGQGTPVTFFRVPTATLSGDTDLCLGEDTNLSIALTGDSPWSVVINGQSITGINSTPFVYNVAPTSTETYVLEGVSDQNCPGTFSGQAEVVIHEMPTINNLSVECNATSTGYTVTFEISGGDPTCYTVNGSPGTLTGNVFVSDEIPTGNGYLFQIDDCNLCGPITVEEPMIICECESLAGDISGNQTICGNGPVVATDEGGHILDANDALCFILHDGDPNSPIAQNPTEPSFQFQPATMNYGQTYYICAVVGNDNGNGCVSVSDPCRSVSANCAEVVFYEIPTATLLGDTVLCAGNPTPLTISFTGGEAPYTFSYEDAFLGTTETLTSMTNTFTFDVTPTNSTVYNLLSVEDAHCVGTASGSFPVTVNQAPTISNLGTLCNDLSTAYTVSFTINSGSPDIIVNPAGSGTVTTSPPYIFTSNEIDATQGYAFEVDNINGCGPVFVSGDAPTCQCLTDAGTMVQNVVAACPAESITALYNNDGNLDPNDVVAFMLHETEGGAFADALQTNTIPTFAFDAATMSTGITYFICPVAGDDNGSGMPDPTDDCFDIGACAPVFWYPTPTADLSGTTTICDGSTTGIDFSATGVGPFTIDYLENNVPMSVTIWGTDTTLTVAPSADTQYQLTGVTDLASGCTNTADALVSVGVSQNVTAGTPTQPAVFCELEDQTVDLGTLLTGADPGGIWKDQNDVPVVNGQFATFGKPAGVYTFTYTVSAQAPCPDASATVEVRINPLPVADAGADQTLNCDLTVGNLGGPNTSTGDFSYQWTGGNLTGTTTPTATTSEAGTYTLTVIDNQTGCSASDEVQVTVDQSAPTPTLSFSDLSCFEAGDGFISLEPITGGAPPYLCSINGGEFTNISTFTNLSAGTYTIVCKDSKGCTVENTVEITQPNPLDVTLTGDFKGNDPIVELGDSVRISVLVNLPFDSLDAIIWSPAEAVPCDTCPSFYITPDDQMTLSITVQEGQCSASDELTILVKKNRPVYVPNAFSPNGDANNDKLLIYGGSSVARIKTFQVFDRWGEVVWEYHDFLPNDPATGWDGTYRGKVLDPGVFVWFAEVEFIDGVVEIYEGDFVLVN